MKLILSVVCFLTLGDYQINHSNAIEHVLLHSKNIKPAVTVTVSKIFVMGANFTHGE